MINNIYFDLDESLIHTVLREPNQSHVKFVLDGTAYYTLIRPCAKELIEFARSLVGVDKVFILTAATLDYAKEVNRLGDFGFEHKNIIAREELSKYSYYGAYGGTCYVDREDASIYNVLIDNLEPRYNESKTCPIGISHKYKERYLHVKDYYGVNFPDDPFEQNVKDFLTNLSEKD